jgi:hypothetical protein
MSKRRRCDPARRSDGARQDECRGVAFSRKGDPNTGEFEDAVVLKPSEKCRTNSCRRECAHRSMAHVLFGPNERDGHTVMTSYSFRN